MTHLFTDHAASCRACRKGIRTRTRNDLCAIGAHITARLMRLGLTWSGLIEAAREAA